MKIIWVAAFVGGVTILLLACSPREQRFRYKMTVEVETPEGLKSGSAVHEIRASVKKHLGLIPPSRDMHTIGEAVAVDLPNQQTLFMLIPSPDRVAQCLDPQWRNDWVESTKRIASGEPPTSPVVYPVGTIERGPTGLPRQVGGLFVRFRDANDPSSVEEVNPADLGGAFGAGYALRRITVQKVDEPVTSGLEQRLPWLPKYYDLQFSGDRFTSAENQKKGLAAFVSSGAFSAGMGLSPHEQGGRSKPN